MCIIHVFLIKIDESVSSVVTFESTFSDHAYAIPIVSPAKQKSTSKDVTASQHLTAKKINTNIDSMETTTPNFEEPPVLTKIDLKDTGNEISTSTDDLPPEEGVLEKPVDQHQAQQPQIEKSEVTPPKPSR